MNLLESKYCFTALRTTFRPAAARDLRATFALRVGPFSLNARVAGGRVAVAEGAPDDADVTIDSGPGIRAVMAGEMSPDDAVAQGVAQVTGDAKLFSRFAEIFRIDPLPVGSHVEGRQ